MAGRSAHRGSLSITHCTFSISPRRTSPTPMLKGKPRYKNSDAPAVRRCHPPARSGGQNSGPKAGPFKRPKWPNCPSGPPGPAETNSSIKRRRLKLGMTTRPAAPFRLHGAARRRARTTGLAKCLTPLGVIMRGPPWLQSLAGVSLLMRVISDAGATLARPPYGVLRKGMQGTHTQMFAAFSDHRGGKQVRSCP